MVRIDRTWLCTGHWRHRFDPRTERCICGMLRLQIETDRASLRRARALRWQALERRVNKLEKVR